MSKYNLGIVKTSLLSNLNETATIKQFVNLLKESNLLKLEYSIFDNIENKYIPNEDLAIKYIDENVKLLKDNGYTKELFESENRKFLPLIEGIEFSNTNKKQLFEKVHCLLYESLPGKKITNVNRLHDSFSYVLEHVKNNEPKVVSESSDLLENIELPIQFGEVDFIVGRSINEFNNKYNNLLTEEELIVLQSVINENTNAKETAFNLIKENAITFFNDFINELKSKEGEANIHEQAEIQTYVERSNQSIDMISKMKFNESTYMDDVVKLIEFKN